MSGRGLDWYKRDPIAFLDGVQGMGPEVIGAYAVLLDLVYARGGETRRDDRHLSGLLGCSKRKAAALTDALIAAGKLTVDGAFITNSRAKSEAKSSRNLSETRANAGRMGGEKSAEVRKIKELPEASASSKGQPEKSREEKKPPTPLEILSGVVVGSVAQDFVDHRKQIKSAMTALAAQRIADKLKGHPDPAAVLNLSIENGWKGIFPEKVTGGGVVNAGAFGELERGR